ncbi:MAG: aminotransferase class V-fold PLP-dependent enzyme [Halobacteriota archaeon]
MGLKESALLDVEAVRGDFPVLERQLNEGRPLVYLDNAATSLTPDPVVEAMATYYRHHNANVHRGLHQLSQEASVAYEEAHDAVASFIGAAGREEVVFTKNTTEGLNLVAQAWGLHELGPADEVVITELEHHSSLVTWQQVAKRTGATLRYIGLTEDGHLDMTEADRLIGEDTALVAAAHVSNALGTINPVAELVDLAHEHGALAVIDGAQAVPTMPVDVGAIDADFYAFSGHKMLGPTGIGVLHGKTRHLEAMEPFLYGGEMIEKVTFEDSRWNELPWKFEAGTPPIAEGLGLHRAVEYLEAIGMDRVRRHEEAVTAYALDRLGAIEDVEIYGPSDPAERGGLVSFNLETVHAHDVASVMNDVAVAIRAGDHCTQPLHDRLGVAASARASFYVYNRPDEVDVLLEGLDAARELLGR